MSNESESIRREVDAVMKKYDRESNTRIYRGLPSVLLRVLLAAFALYFIYDALFSVGLVQQARLALFVGVVTVLGYLVYPAKKGDTRVNHIPWYDVLLILAAIFVFGYFVLNARLLVELRMSRYTWYHIAMGIAALVVVFEVCRRSVGLPILLVAGAFMVYALFVYQAGQVEFLRRLQNLMKSLVFSTEGILSTPINVCAKFIAVFILFGAFLERSGVADFFIQLANAAVGKYSGGPAKVAVIASALEGMASGSSVANTVGSGSITIPMMKKTGYRPEFAAAVEAAASTGGQIMPPIMGAAAFLMAEFLGASYGFVAVRAILPAILYFAGIFLSVHLEAKKLGLTGIPKELLPKFRQLLGQSFLLLPLILLVTLITSGTMTIQKAAVLCIASVIAVGLLNKKERLTLSKVFDALAAGAQGTIAVAAACAMAGIIAGCITMTGLASVLKAAVVSLSGGYVFPALFMTMLVCIVLGMGVPTTANYCIMASTCAPILVEMGVPMLAAHMFVFYFGIVADITPPVALAAYAGSAIAGSKPMKTAFIATKLAVAAFIVPYMFALSPQMLLIDTDILSFLRIILTSVVGMFGLSVGLEGYLTRHVPWPLRIFAAAGGLMLIHPGLVTDIVGLSAVALVVVTQLAKKRA